jgi:phosphate uptake regulator
MRRKLIGQGLGGCTVSLPIKWVRAQKLKPGDDVEIIETPTGELSLYSEKVVSSEKRSKTIDVDGMNSYQIKRLIRGLYRSRVDEIVLTYTNKTLVQARTGGSRDLLKQMDDMTRRLIGLEITEKKPGRIVLQCFMSREEIGSIDRVERRIFYMIKQFMDDIIETPGKLDGDELHDRIAKFCEYYMRVVVFSDMDTDKKMVRYQIVHALDKTLDFLRYLCNALAKNKPSKKVIEFLADTFVLFDMFYRFYYGIEGMTSRKVVDFRYKMIYRLRHDKWTLNEYKLLSEVYYILNINNEFHELLRV